MSRRVVKGKGVRVGAPAKARKGLGGLKRPGTTFGSAPKGYSSGLSPSYKQGAKGREEAHPGHRMTQAGRRARKFSSGH